MNQIDAAYTNQRITDPADPALGDLLAIQQEAGRWLLAQGIRQWLPEETRIEPLLRHVLRDEVYVLRATVSGEVVGGYALQWADPETWGEQAPAAGYVHGLCVRRDHAGKGLGRRLLDDAAQRVAAAGRQYLRLDCMAANSKLRAFYEQAGFAYRGLTDDTGAARYERQVGV